MRLINSSDRGRNAGSPERAIPGAGFRTYIPRSICAVEANCPRRNKFHIAKIQNDFIRISFRPLFLKEINYIFVR